MKNKKGVNRFLPKGKKGAELTVGTIVIIVLALVVLVVLILGFTGGWGNLWGRITSFFGGSNVDSVVQSCQVACTTLSTNDYCTRMRTVKAEENVFYVEDGKIVNGDEGVLQAKEGKASCKTLAELHSGLGFKGCPEIEPCPTG